MTVERKEAAAAGMSAQEMDIRLEPEGEHRLYAAEDVLHRPLTLTVVAEAIPERSGADGALRCRVVVKDVRGRTVFETERPAECRGDGAAVAAIELVLAQTGYYEAAAELLAPDGAALRRAETEWAVVPGPHPGPRPESFFATNVHLDQGHYRFDRMIGVKMYRGHFAASGPAGPASAATPETWRPERKPDDPIDYDFRGIERVVRTCREHDIGIVGLVGYANPEWARAETARGKRHWGPPRDDDEFIRATVPIVARFPEVKYVEFWNEPWVYGWTWADTAERFRRLHNKWIDEARKVRPDLVVVSGESASYLEDHLYIDAETTRRIDVACHHPYAEIGHPNGRQGKVLRTVDYHVRLAEKHGVGRSFLTEGGVVDVWESDREKIKTAAKQIVVQHVLGALAGLYQMNIQHNMGFETTQLAGAAAYGVMTHLLEDRVPVADLWPAHPLIWGAVFANKRFADANETRANEFSARWSVPVPPEYEDDRLKVAVLWSWMGESPERLAGGTIAFEAAARDIRVLDFMGAPCGEVRDGQWVVPFTAEPVYVTSEELEAGGLAALLRSARIECGHPVNLFVHLITEPLDRSPALTVCIQNQLNRPIRGRLTAVGLPDGWRAKEGGVAYELAAGEIAELRVGLAEAKPNEANRYAVRLRADHDDAPPVEYGQIVQAAVASRKTVRLTGRLSDWDGVVPTTTDSRMLRLGVDPTHYALNPDAARPEGTPEAAVVTRTYAAYDETKLYIGFAVEEPSFSQTADGDPDGLDKPWLCGDLFDIAFAFRDRAPNSFRQAGDPWYWKGGYRDTEYEYALFRDKHGRDRFTRLRRPDSPRTTPYQLERSAVHYPYVGEVEGAEVMIARDEPAKLTLYEVAIPLSEFGVAEGGLREPLRFGFVQWTDEKLPAIEYAKAAGVFDYWCGGDTFLPSWLSFHACTTRLGLE
ncbi:hypothetical protein [Paenibacillus flagellatus]|uniref:Uncharacterized protein n=1 Tax=Paenibacillus flagellatus TaxID=2211139 RepID=A0A2V5K6I0_9BACL|nr:hypothetical protein [Paenibacillus flagellatus]PYI53373.1 hypothetical protein DLM86_16445 [Paenibacillus flagellatus]